MLKNKVLNKRHIAENQIQFELEIAVLNKILQENEVRKKIIDFLEEEDFLFPKNRIIFEAIKKIHEEGKDIDILSVVLFWNKRQKKIDYVYLVDIIRENFIADTTAIDIAKKLKERSIKQRFLKENLSIRKLIQEAKQLEEYEFEQQEENNSFSLYDIISNSTIDPKIKWIIPGFLPKGGITDIFGGPESGKTTFLLTLLISLAHQISFYPFTEPEKEYKTLIIGGEKNSLENWKRSICFALQTLSVNNIEKLDNIRILDTFSDAKKIENKYLLKLNEKEREWEETKTWQKMIYEIEKFQPDILLFDTLSACFLGYTPNLWAEHQKLLLKLSVLAKQYNLTILTVSHTNQQSKFEPITKRLDYTARSGNNGIPGELRCILGFTHLNPKEITVLNLDSKRKYIVCCVAKSNDFIPHNTMLNPLLFQIYEGQLQYIKEIDTIYLEEEVKKINKKFFNSHDASNSKHPQKNIRSITNDKLRKLL